MPAVGVVVGAAPTEVVVVALGRATVVGAVVGEVVDEVKGAAAVVEAELEAAPLPPSAGRPDLVL